MYESKKSDHCQGLKFLIHINSRQVPWMQKRWVSQELSNHRHWLGLAPSSTFPNLCPSNSDWAAHCHPSRLPRSGSLPTHQPEGCFQQVRKAAVTLLNGFSSLAECDLPWLPLLPRLLSPLHPSHTRPPLYLGPRPTPQMVSPPARSLHPGLCSNLKCHVTRAISVWITPHLPSSLPHFPCVL